MQNVTTLTLLVSCAWTTCTIAVEPTTKSQRTSTRAPVILVADGLNKDGSLVENYQRGLRYAINYFGNYGPYYVYLLGPDSETSVRTIYRQRATSRANPDPKAAARQPLAEFLRRPSLDA